MREYTYVGAAVTSGMVDDGTADPAPSRRTCMRRVVFNILARAALRPPMRRKYVMYRVYERIVCGPL